eukprot:TRINITY_DN83717_c0_g1_i1.p1 TRINITY_DN83717_c0_g1~~TRINITY_DN83717_c0_g1_i1.p1  ORF type:complete len:562 (-),score=39.63 TRINITY_DN83717_c0_g1_i1:2-1567(-)
MGPSVARTCRLSRDYTCVRINACSARSWPIFQRRPHAFLVVTTAISARFSVSDPALGIINVMGIASSLLLCTLPVGWACGCSALAAAGCYLSLVHVAGAFMGLQMHSNLVETNALFALCSPAVSQAPWVLVLANWILLFRIMLGGGAGKWAADEPAWKDFTAMKYHYWTQPLPNSLSNWFHRLPDKIHRLSVITTFIIEGPLCLLMFAPQCLRILPFLGFTSILLTINLCGNYGHLGFLTMVEAFAMLNDYVWRAVLPTVLLPSRPAPQHGSFPAHHIYGASVILVYTAASIPPFVQAFAGQNPLRWIAARFPLPLLLWQKLAALPFFSERVLPAIHCAYNRLAKYHRETFPRWRVLGRYVKFASMTKNRWEIIVEVSSDGQDWREIPFRYKPSALALRPPIVPGHMPSLDWQLWFLALDASRGHRDPPQWFINFLQRLADGTPEVWALMGMAEAPIDVRYVRAQLYDYRFPSEQAGHHCCTSPGDNPLQQARPSKPGDWWWRRQLHGQYGPVVGIRCKHS